MVSMTDLYIRGTMADLQEYVKMLAVVLQAQMLERNLFRAPTRYLGYIDSSGAGWRDDETFRQLLFDASASS